MNKISKCRICGNTNLKKIINLGNLVLTGVFPKSKKENISSGDLELIKCHGNDDSYCGLVQLSNSFDLNEMYGDNYGYRSSLNLSMVNHLEKIVEKIKNQILLNKSDLVIDIGSNDGTTLSFYDSSNLNLVGIDPTALRFKKYYDKNVKIISDFFSYKIIEKHNYFNKAKVITSFAMFYDLEDPIDFAKTISKTLDKNEGVWLLEQSYLPSMLKFNAYDTICHEHLEYYSLKQIKYICDHSNLKIIDVELTKTNGGSFLIKCSHKKSKYQPNLKNINQLLEYEKNEGIDDLKIYDNFKINIENSKKVLKNLIDKINKSGQKVYGIGASTKGNVILQYCDLSTNDINSIGEVNLDKFNSLTPGTNIPIVDENLILNSKDNYLLILPWHFKEFFINSKNYKNQKLIFPLPELEVIDC